MRPDAWLVDPYQFIGKASKIEKERRYAGIQGFADLAGVPSRWRQEKCGTELCRCLSIRIE
jgi:hypothetical protein